MCLCVCVCVCTTVCFVLLDLLLSITHLSKESSTSSECKAKTKKTHFEEQNLWKWFWYLYIWSNACQGSVGRSCVVSAPCRSKQELVVDCPIEQSPKSRDCRITECRRSSGTYSTIMSICRAGLQGGFHSDMQNWQSLWVRLRLHSFMPSKCFRMLSDQCQSHQVLWLLMALLQWWNSWVRDNSFFFLFFLHCIV